MMVPGGLDGPGRFGNLINPNVTNCDTNVLYSDRDLNLAMSLDGRNESAIMQMAGTR